MDCGICLVCAIRPIPVYESHHFADSFNVLVLLLGNLALCRFHSKHIALRMCFKLVCATVSCTDMSLKIEIKAMEEGIFGTRYDPVAN
jgi:uncharacterized YccA/Bax inhibitor family protein